MRYCLIFLALCLASCGEIEFPGGSVDPAQPSVPDASVPHEEELPSETILTDVLPAPCSLWRDHAVALVARVQGTAAASEALVTLISLYDWNALPSARNASAPTLATSIAQGYQEYELTGWRIPTADEAKALRGTYAATEDLATLLHAADASPIDMSARYLCEEAQKTFSFAPNTTVSTAGAKASNYRLRLVKTLRLKLEEQATE